jgi:hypothetical protein
MQQLNSNFGVYTDWKLYIRMKAYRFKTLVKNVDLRVCIIKLKCEVCVNRLNVKDMK